MNKEFYKNVYCIEFTCNNTTLKIIDVNEDFEKTLNITNEYVLANNLDLMSFFDDNYSKKLIPELRDDLNKFGRISTVLQPVFKNGKNDKQYFVYCKYASNNKETIHVRCFDISDYLLSDESTYSENSRYKMLEENTGEFHFNYEVKTDTLYLPKEIAEKYGIDRVMHNYIRSNIIEETLHKDDIQAYIDRWNESISKPVSKQKFEFRTNIFTGQYRWLRANYLSVCGPDGKTVTHVTGRIYEINDQKDLIGKVESSANLIKKLNSYDTLTKVYNLKTFTSKLTNKINEIDNKELALVYSDINNFSYINSYYGDESGNDILKNLAKTLIDQKDISLVGRVYCDFFVYLISADTKDDILKRVEEIAKTISNKVFKYSTRLTVKLSSGVCFIDDKKEKGRILIDNANLARRYAKASNHINYYVYNETLRKERIKEQEIASNIHTAISNGFIEAFLQPKFRMDTKEIIGAEALARWRKEDGTYRSPAEFIDILEKIGYIIDLDWEIFRQTLTILKKWIDMGAKTVPISVNFSRVHIDQEDFVDRIIKMTDEYKIPHNLIEIEITESAIAKDHKLMKDELKTLQKNGFVVDMDDFGTGFSSLSFLVNIPIDIIKVDRTFVTQVGSSDLNKLYVRNLCKLITTTGKDVIFEGVETQEQIDFFLNCGFNKAQGWFFDKAIPIKNFEKKYIFELKKEYV